MSINKVLTNRILEADRPGAMKLIDGWCDKHSIDQVVEKVLVPALATLSTIWDKLLDPPLAPAYVTSRVIQDVMKKVADNVPQHEKVERGPVVMCNIEDDFHSLGREVVTAFLQAYGWRVYDLGNDVPAAELIDKAEEVGAKVVGASAMMLTTALNIKHVREEIDRRGLNGHIQLAAGGAIFTLRDNLIDEVGGDGTCRTAVGAHELFQSLWEKAEQLEAKDEQ